MTLKGRVAVCCWLTVTVAACSDRTSLADQGFYDPADAPAGAAGAHPPSDVPHGDHTPHQGGTVMMYGDLHYEVLLKRDGRYAMHLSNELREVLPASTVSDVSFTIKPPEGRPETVKLEPNTGDTAWFGVGEPVSDPKTVVRVAFTYFDRPYWIDLMFPRAEFEAPADGVPEGLRAPPTAGMPGGAAAQ